VTERIRVLLADDHGVLRAGLRALLSAQEDMEVIGEAADGLQAVELAERLQPDVLVMDITMPNLDGLGALRRIAEMGLPVRVLILTVHAEARYLLPVLQAGGSGYVLKSGADTDLIAAIRAVHGGNAFLYPDHAQLLLEDYQRRVSEGSEPDVGDRLSDRERDVLRLTAQGFSSSEIAGQLYLSPKTVDTYRQRLMEKLNLHHRSELVNYALRHGLLRATD
jgi:two-component system response regulator NreC